MHPPAHALTHHHTDVVVDESTGTAFVRVRGGIDAASAPALRAALTRTIDRHKSVVVDLSGAVTIDRSGLSLLLQILDRAYWLASGIRFADPSPLLLAALRTLNADAMFSPFVTTEPDDPGGGRATNRSAPG